MRCASAVATVEGMTVARYALHRTFVLFALLSACSSDPDGATDDADAGAVGRGSAACHEWQKAYCDWNTTCNGPSAACEQVKGIYCKSDDDASRCAAAMPSATCPALPADCDVGVIADRSWAQKACEDFAASFCARVDACLTGTEEPCMDQVKSVLDCVKALGVTLSYEQCMSSVPNMDCKTLTVPPACRGVLLLGE
jgi:hypothetical protein